MYSHLEVDELVSGSRLTEKMFFCQQTKKVFKERRPLSRAIKYNGANRGLHQLTAPQRGSAVADAIRFA